MSVESMINQLHRELEILRKEVKQKDDTIQSLLSIIESMERDRKQIGDTLWTVQNYAWQVVI